MFQLQLDTKPSWCFSHCGCCIWEVFLERLFFPYPVTNTNFESDLSGPGWNAWYANSFENIHEIKHYFLIFSSKYCIGNFRDTVEIVFTCTRYFGFCHFIKEWLHKIFSRFGTSKQVSKWKGFHKKYLLIWQKEKFASQKT